MKRFIKFMMFEFNNSGSRNKRELSVVADFDCEIIVCSVGEEDAKKTINGLTVYQRVKQLSSNPRIRKIQIINNWFIEDPRYLRNMQADYISCHDIIAFFIGWVSTWFVPKNKKPILIYDSHEFELGRNTSGKRKRIIHWAIPCVEKFLMGKAAFSMFACDSAAEEVQRIYELKEKPVVVRNIPNYWHIDENECKSKRLELCRMMDVPDNTFIAIYHGLISNGRGIENIIESITMTTNTAAIILGFGDVDYIAELQELCKEQNVDQRVLFLEAVSLEVLYKYLGAADVGMVTIPAVTKSYYYMLPNKFFENIQSLTPVICSAFPEVSRIVNQYDIGLLVDPENVNEIAGAIMKLQNDKELYKRLKNNLRQAKEDLCWENEREVLKKAYERIMEGAEYGGN